MGMETVHAEDNLGQYGAAESPAAPVVVAARDELVQTADHEAEAYVHQEIEAEPYVHEAIEAEPYVHDPTGDVSEPYVHQTGPAGRPIGRKRIAASKAGSSHASAASRSFS